MNEGFTAAGFAFKLRTQFSFYADDSLLSCVLGRLAERGISITGYMQTKFLELGERDYSRCDRPLALNLVRFVVGAADVETGRDLAGVRSALDLLGVKYQEKQVIQMLQVVPGTVGVLSGVFSALWCRVAVYAVYVGEDTRNFLDVSDVCKALRVLSGIPLEPCARQVRMEEEI